MLTPLPEQDADKSSAVMDQPFPERPMQRSVNESSYDQARHQADDFLDDLPLDEHPFFHKFAEMLPTGLAILDHKAQAIFVNKPFYQLTTHVGEDQSFKAWPNSIHKEDYEKVIQAYKEAFKSQKRLRTEYRTAGEGSLWRLLLLTPLGDENLRHVSLRDHGGFICCIVDITSEKSAELAQRKAAKEARDRKEQQERFIDMISHEIRNPLSAILHCAEDILELAKDESVGEKLRESMVDAAETIVLCTNHQRHIVDDVLSFSKLDALMLSLSPMAVQPKSAIAKTLKMFQPEFRKSNLEFEYKVDVSYGENDLDWVMADLRRIGQVVINLLSNAIKFTTKKQGEKKITVAVGASSQRPTSYPPSVVFFDPDDSSHRLDATRSSEWGNGEEMYVMVAIIDTGIGIGDKDQKKLFQRFRQATPKTEEVYGGSGLGLNISRKLCQLHGGDIGVSSKEGVGSTFGFFFRVRRTEEAAKRRSSEEEDRDFEDLSRQISTFGYKPSKEIDRDHMPKELRDPEIAKVPEATPGDSSDDRHEHTARIAAEVSMPSNELRHSAPNSDLDQSTPADQQDKLEPRDKRSEANEASHEAESTKEIGFEHKARDQNQKESDQAGSRPARTNQHILLVEDNLINQKILWKKLTSKGFVVQTANNGREAVDAVMKSNELHGDGVNKSTTKAIDNEGDDNISKIKTNSSNVFDCILMDQEMPVMDGNQASREIRRLENEKAPDSSKERSHVPILGVTANVRHEQREEMIQAGMDDVIHKPYRIEEMIDMIRKLTGGADEIFKS